MGACQMDRQCLGTGHKTLGEHRTCQTSIRPRNTKSNRLSSFFPMTQNVNINKANKKENSLSSQKRKNKIK